MKIEHFAMYVIDLEAVKDFFVRYFNAVSDNMYHNKKTDFKSYFLSFTSLILIPFAERKSRTELVFLPASLYICIYYIIQNIKS